MGLYTILKKHRLKDRQLRLLFLGLDAAGKSTIVARLLSPNSAEALKDISPTLGFKISTIEFENYKLNICMSLSVCLLTEGDVGGQKTLRAYWKNYFEQTDGVVWVVDSTDRERLRDCAIELHNLLQEEVPHALNELLVNHAQRLMGASLLILANKRDLPNCISLEDIQNVRLAVNAGSLMQDRHYPCL